MLDRRWNSIALAVWRSKIPGRQPTWVVVGAIIVMLAGRLLPNTGGDYLFTAGMMGFTGMPGYRALSPPGRVSPRALTPATDSQPRGPHAISLTGKLTAAPAV